MKSVILTGAAGGIGMAALRHLATDHVVYAGYLDDWERSILESVVVEFGPERIKPVLCDLRDFEQIDELVARVELEAADLRAVIANGGVCPLAQPLEHTNFAIARDINETNLMGNAKLAQRCLPLLKKARGRLIFVGSLWGIAEGPMLWAYSASKHGLEALAVCSRRELRQFGIDVVMINPGLVKKTYMTGRQHAGARSLLVEAGIDPKEIADVTFDPGGNTMLKDARAVPDPRYDRGYAGLYWMLSNGLNPAKMKACCTAEDCGRVVDIAVRAHRPKLRYIVGWDAKLTVLLNRLLPAKWMDRLIVAGSTR